MTVWVVVQFVVGLLLLIAGAEVLVRGASRLAAAVGISPLVIGLTVVAFGTSSPELAVSIQSAWSGQADIAVGNVVGSNIFNILFILGLSSVLLPLAVAQQLVRLDVPLMIGASILVTLLALDLRLAAWEGALLFAGIVAYTIFLVRSSRRETAAVVEEYTHEYGAKPPPGGATWVFNLILVVVGLAMLVFGSRWLVAAAVTMAQAAGISELVIGLTIVAAGTSMPEVATSVVAALRGERDIAVGNVVGSNLFNLLAVLGLTALIAPGGVSVSLLALEFDMPFMIVVAIACLPIFFTAHTISRWEGAIFLVYYAAYTGYLILRANESAGLPYLVGAITFFLAPLTLLTIGITVFQELRGRARAGS